MTEPTRIYPFHARYPNLPELFHTACDEHPDWGVCGERHEAESAVFEHLHSKHRKATR